MFDSDAPLERLPDESVKANSALLAYASLGPGRSLEKLRQKYGKNAAYTRQLERWSSQHNWQERIKIYDTEMAREHQRRISEQYLRDLEEHRDRYGQTGKELYVVSRVLLGKLAQAMQDDELPLNTASLHAVVRSLQLSVELEAHSLSLDRLLPMLDVADKNG